MQSPIANVRFLFGSDNFSHLGHHPILQFIRHIVSALRDRARTSACNPNLAPHGRSYFHRPNHPRPPNDSPPARPDLDRPSRNPAKDERHLAKPIVVTLTDSPDTRCNDDSERHPTITRPKTDIPCTFRPDGRLRPSIRRASTTTENDLRLPLLPEKGIQKRSGSSIHLPSQATDGTRYYVPDRKILQRTTSLESTTTLSPHRIAPGEQNFRNEKRVPRGAPSCTYRR